LILWLAWACSAPDELGGRVVDALSGTALGAVRVKASALDAADPACAEITADVAEDGSFTLPKRCEGTRYALALADEGLRIDPVEIVGGQVGEIELRAWPLPGEGVWSIGAAGVVGLRPQATAREDVLVGGAAVRFPDVLPSDPPAVGPEEWLLLAGSAHVGAAVVPLLPAEALRFGAADAPREVGPWSYLGAKIEGDVVQAVTASPAEDKVVKHDIDGLSAAWIRGDALQPGTYAVEGPDRKLFVVRFGVEP
jgi:hypothetical protein